MTERDPESQEMRQAGLAPETHNDEQDDHRSQAQEVAEQARNITSETRSPLESEKQAQPYDIVSQDAQDTIDQMHAMETSGRIDMNALAGEPNHDDNVDKYGEERKPDGLRGDGS